MGFGSFPFTSQTRPWNFDSIDDVVKTASLYWNGSAWVPITLINGKILVDTSFQLDTIDSLALAVSALADVSQIATSATELTATEKNQLRAIFAAYIRFLIPQI